MKNNFIFIILLVFFAMTFFFWFQVARIKEAPIPKISTPPVVNGAEAEAFVKLAQELLINYQEPLPELYARDPFNKNYMLKPEEPSKVEKSPSEVFVLSSIVYSNSNPFAVVNGRILAEGDAVYSEELESEFMIEDISFGKVDINNGGKKYTLKIVH